MNYNKVIIGGHLTRDVELKHTPNSAVANFGIAVNHKWTDKSGEKKEDVCFVDCEAWGKTAEVMAQYLGKGRAVLIEGRLKLDQWEDKESGQKRSKLKVVVDSFQFADSKGGDKPADDAPEFDRKPAATVRRPARVPAAPDDGIPF